MLSLARGEVLRLLTPKSCYPNLLLPLFRNPPNFQKAEEAKRKDSPARRCLQFQISKSKTQKENHLFYRKRSLRASDGLNGSGDRSCMIENVPTQDYLTVYGNAQQCLFGKGYSSHSANP